MPLRPEPVSLTEPPDEAAWHLCREQYERTDMVADALDWVGTANLNDDQEATVIEWFQESDAYRTAIEDRLDGEP